LNVIYHDHPRAYAENKSGILTAVHPLHEACIHIAYNQEVDDMISNTLLTDWGKKAREVGRDKLTPMAAEIDRNGVYDPRNLGILIAEGLIAPPIPKEYGGLGIKEVEFQEIMREISRASTSAASMITCQMMAAYGIMSGASESQKQRYLPRMAKGELIGTPAITETHAGSDVGAIRTEAKLQGDRYILDGKKALVSYLGVADIYLTFAKTAPDKGNKGITAFIVHATNRGLTCGEPLQKMGQRGLSTGAFTLDACEVPAEDRVGEEGQGFYIAMDLLNRSRLLVASQALGTATAAFEAALEYAKTRTAFGKPLIAQQAIAFKLADMAIKLHNAQLSASHAAQKIDEGKDKDYILDIAIAKVYASEIAREVTNDAVQIHGGIGYTSEYPVERYYRDQRVMELYGGTSEIQRVVISRILSGESKLK
jgi:alkylation response protein AidB-like acyl-CoA dehydrogenase